MQENPKIYIVTNQYGNGLNVRSKPDTNTGKVMRTMTNGEGFQTYDVFTLGNQTWARVSRGDQVIQEYACIAIGNKIYAREQISTTTEPMPTAWTDQIDAWARSNGYNGVKP